MKKIVYAKDKNSAIGNPQMFTEIYERSSKLFLLRKLQSAKSDEEVNMKIHIVMLLEIVKKIVEIFVPVSVTG